MADQRGIIRYVRAVFDKASGQKMQADFADALETAGEVGSREYFKAVRERFAREQARIKEEVARGLITPEEARRRGQQAAQQFNAGMITGMDQARAQGKLTDREFVKLSKTLKTTGDTGSSAFARIGASMKTMMGAAVAGFGAYQVLSFLRSSVQASNDLEASARKLSATAKITGVEFEFLTRTAAAANEQFKLGPSLANDLTIELTKLASKAGDVAMAGPGLAAFLDLGAARGYDAAATLKAVQQSILGIDEGTDKLFGKNPSVLYKEFADSIGTTAGALSDAQKAQAILTAAMNDGGKVRGEYSRWLESTAGKQFLFNQEITKAKQRIGDELRPAIEDALPSLITLVELFGKLSTLLVQISAVPLGNITKLLDALANPRKAFGEELSRAAETWRNRIGYQQTNAPRSAQTRQIQEGLARGVAARNLANWQPSTGTSAPPPDPAAEAAAKRAAEERARAAEQAAADERRKQEYYDYGRYKPGVSPLGPMAGGEERGVRMENGVPTIGGMRGVGFVEPILDANADAAEQMLSPWESALIDIEHAFYTSGGLISQAAEALADGGIRGLGRFAAAKVKENLAAALEMGARAIGALVFGNPAAAAAAGKAAAGHAAAAAAWKVASAAMGGGGSTSASVTGALGGGGNVGGRTADRATQAGAEVHIYIDPLDPQNPAYQRNIIDTEQRARQRYGESARIYTHRRTG